MEREHFVSALSTGFAFPSAVFSDLLVFMRDATLSPFFIDVIHQASSWIKLLCITLLFEELNTKSSLCLNRVQYDDCATIH